MIIFAQKSVADPLHDPYLPGYSKSIRATPQLTKMRSNGSMKLEIGILDENRDLKIYMQEYNYCHNEYKLVIYANSCLNTPILSLFKCFTSYHCDFISSP